MHAFDGQIRNFSWVCSCIGNHLDRARVTSAFLLFFVFVSCHIWQVAGLHQKYNESAWLPVTAFRGMLDNYSRLIFFYLIFFSLFSPTFFTFFFTFADTHENWLDSCGHLNIWLVMPPWTHAFEWSKSFSWHCLCVGNHVDRARDINVFHLFFVSVSYHIWRATCTRLEMRTFKWTMRYKITDVKIFGMKIFLNLQNKQGFTWLRRSAKIEHYTHY